MGYNLIAQTEHDAVAQEDQLLAHASRNDRSPVLGTSTSNPAFLTKTVATDNEPDYEDITSPRGGSVLRSLASSQSYEVIQDNDFDEGSVAPLRIRKREPHILSPTFTQSPTFSQSQAEEEDIPVRTASISRHLPLSHPKPDLQSMQGTYVRNVERLEESAERLSITSSIEEESQRMKWDQWPLNRQSSAPTRHPAQIDTSRQVSVGALSNSITGVNAAARWGGYSPSGYVTSFQEATRSGSWSQSSHPSRLVSKASRHQGHQSQPNSQGNSLEPSPILDPPPPPPPHAAAYHATETSVAPNTDLKRLPSNASAERPLTSASSETYGQAKSLFRDFDGVHYSAQSHASFSREVSLRRQISLSHPPLATDAKAFPEPQPGQHMVYYPAPVPMMLNLPQKLSKISAMDRDKRRTQALSGLPAEMRKSAPWLLGEEMVPGNHRQSRQTLASMPPQLRASAFFDQPSMSPDLKLQGGSAVDTLDSILNASAHAPVSAFTDHPIVGQLGKEVYGKEANRKSSQPSIVKSKKAARRVSSLSNMLGAGRRLSEALSLDNAGRHVSRESKASELEADVYGETNGSLHRPSEELERLAEESIRPSNDELSDNDDGDDEELEAEEELDTGFISAPTTLLAELQMRKAQQKQRNRTAADAFPNGMHSTLLELDAVTQLQQKSRKQKHITLAWEDHDAADQQNFDDEDVPLGVLFPGQIEQANANRPIGLLEKRHIEDNEPLSQRRARLKGDTFSMQATSVASVKQNRTGSMYTLDVPGMRDNHVPEQEGETLAQRLKRLRAERERAHSGQFAPEGTSQLGLKIVDENAPPVSKTPNAEETLGQRKKRLQEEATKARQASGGSAQSVHPPVLNTRHSMASLLSAHPVNGGRIVSNGSAEMKAQTIGAQQQTVFTNMAPPFGMPSNVPAMPQTTSFGFPGCQPGMSMLNNAFTYNTPPIYSPNVAMQMQMSGQPLAMHPQMPGMALGMGISLPLDPKQRDGIERWRQSVA